ncbi:MAG: hypothetical protein ACUVQV_04365 [Dissulfurimicrobium sp.]|uniref:hypothetical protein n=1 Tax=Dissulfurimicrobium sp. TaxID=2022436 RepID=UPI00404A9C9C
MLRQSLLAILLVLFPLAARCRFTVPLWLCLIQPNLDVAVKHFSAAIPETF